MQPAELIHTLQARGYHVRAEKGLLYVSPSPVPKDVAALVRDHAALLRAYLSAPPIGPEDEGIDDPGRLIPGVDWQQSAEKWRQWDETNERERQRQAAMKPKATRKGR